MAHQPGTRVRLRFADRRLLTKDQRSAGLRRCWLLLRREMRTIEDLASTVYRRFDLRRTCPDGIFFKMDGFVLPRFESTCIFLDKDLISVHKICKKKKLITGGSENQCKKNKLITGGNENQCKKNKLITEGSENQLAEILTIESSEEIEEENEKAIFYLENKRSKRKLNDLEKPECSKKKKRKMKTPEKPLIIEERKENGNTSEYQDSEINEITSEDQDSGNNENISEDHDSGNNENLENNKNTNVDHDSGNSENTSEDKDSENNGNTSENQNKNLENNKNTHENQDLKMTVSSPSDSDESSPPVEPQRNNQLEVSSDKNRSEKEVTDSTGKASRNLRRRRAQRKLRKELKNIEREKKQSGLLTNGAQTEIPSSSNQEIAVNYSTKIAEKPSSVVPVLVRPGHIRFESDDDDEGPSNKQQNVVSSNDQFNDPMENFQWNGITKAKGQKWGQGSKRKNDSFNESNWTHSNWQNENNNENNVQTKDIITSENGKGKASVDFESLPLLTRSPKDGDILVYHVVELSANFCPEVSSYRVGKVKMYDPILKKIILDPVPEYPIFPEKKENDGNNENEDEIEDENETLNLQDLSLYKEDGSLEIEFGALLDLRLLKEKENNAESASASSLSRKSKNKSPIINNNNYNNWESNASVSNAPNYNNNNWNQLNSNQQDNNNHLKTEPNNVPTGNVENEREPNGWNKSAPNTSTPSWSYHALRGSALGPTIAWLRGNNNDNNNDDDNNCTNNSTRENCRGRGRGRRGRRGRGRNY